MRRQDSEGKKKERRERDATRTQDNGRVHVHVRVRKYGGQNEKRSGGQGSVVVQQHNTTERAGADGAPRAREKEERNQGRKEGRERRRIGTDEKTTTGYYCLCVCGARNV